MFSSWWVIMHISPIFRNFYKTSSMENNWKEKRTSTPLKLSFMIHLSRQPSYLGMNLTLCKIFCSWISLLFFFGTEGPGRVAIDMIKHNSNTSTKQTQAFATYLDNQLSILIKVYKCVCAMVTCLASFNS